jgi:long-chain acyl-CoA synthetase
VRAHLAEQRVPPDAAAAAVQALVQRSIDKVNATLASYETIKKFAVIETPLTVTEGLLTATLKVRRKKVYERFRDLFEALY